MICPGLCRRDMADGCKQSVRVDRPPIRAWSVRPLFWFSRMRGHGIGLVKTIRPCRHRGPNVALLHVLHALDLWYQRGVAFGSGTATVRLMCRRGVPAITVRGNLQHLADQLDPERRNVADEAPRDLSWRSSSYWAKKHSSVSEPHSLGATP